MPKKIIALAIPIVLLAGCGGETTSPFNQPSNSITNYGSNSKAPSSATVKAPLVPVYSTDQVLGKPGDVAIWNHPKDPAMSLIIGVDSAASDGALLIFDTHGKVKSRITGLKSPSQIDIEYGFDMGGKKVDIVVVGEQETSKLRIWIIQSSGTLQEVTGSTSLPKGEFKPLGLALYKGESGRVTVLLSPIDGPKTDHLLQVDLTAADGKINAQPARRFGTFSGKNPAGEGSVPALLVDDEQELIYYIDTNSGIRKYSLDPKQSKELGLIPWQGSGQLADLSLYRSSEGDFLLCTESLKSNTLVHLYPRDKQHGKMSQPEVAQFKTSADLAAGAYATGQPFDDHESGVILLSNLSGRTFHVYDWGQVENAIRSAKSTGRMSTSGASGR